MATQAPRGLARRAGSAANGMSPNPKPKKLNDSLIHHEYEGWELDVNQRNWRFVIEVMPRLCGFFH